MCTTVLGFPLVYVNFCNILAILAYKSFHKMQILFNLKYSHFFFLALVIYLEHNFFNSNKKSILLVCAHTKSGLFLEEYCGFNTREANSSQYNFSNDDLSPSHSIILRDFLRILFPTIKRLTKTLH